MKLTNKKICTARFEFLQNKSYKQKNRIKCLLILYNSPSIHFRSGYFNLNILKLRIFSAFFSLTGNSIYFQRTKKFRQREIERERNKKRIPLLNNVKYIF